MAATQTMTKKTEQKPPPAPQSKGQVTVLGEPRLPFHPMIQEQFGLDQHAWAFLVDSIFPSARTTNGVALALNYCKHRKLDIFKKPVHVVPVWSSQLNRMVEGVWPSIAELRITASRTGEYAGKDETVFGENVTETFEGRVKDGQNGWKTDKITLTFPSWARVTVYRIVKGVRAPFVGPRIHWLAAYGRIGNTKLPNEMWQRRYSEQLEKCAEAGGLRCAFPEEIGHMMTAEEMEGQIVDITPAGVEAAEPTGGAPPKPQRSDFKEGATDAAEAKPADEKAAGNGDPAKPEAKNATKDATPKAKPPTPDQEQAYDVLAEDLSYCQNAADIDELTTYRKAMIDSLHPSHVPVWNQSVEKKHAELTRRK